jgi:hypothetical protein
VGLLLFVLNSEVCFYFCLATGLPVSNVLIYCTPQPKMKKKYFSLLPYCAVSQPQDNKTIMNVFFVSKRL